MTAWWGLSSLNEPTLNASYSKQRAEAAKQYDAALSAALKRGFIRQGDFIHDFKDEIIAVGTVFIAAFTVILAFATGFLYVATRDLVNDAKDTSRRQLRAYVFLDQIDLPRFDIDDRRRIMIAWKNTGATRTRRFVAKVSHASLDLTKHSIESFDFHDEPDAQTFHGLIGPNQSVNAPPIPIINDHLFGGDNRALLIWGWAEYQDIFSDAIRRTEFGFRVLVEGGQKPYSVRTNR
jgi:hypothetical protein